eukprot:CAMPEP_0117571934 /NCGR_PEP_ID=MMETSP0784-20121206/60043_2 /TAXON_ID=39447 /ORGANISM="" /LENGTH=245 /DNA_ID=CAMNT_0005370181 /DNA_START=139 /DNA_END=877 /DNA_ORIENTATION=-
MAMSRHHQGFASVSVSTLGIPPMAIKGIPDGDEKQREGQDELYSACDEAKNAQEPATARATEHVRFGEDYLFLLNAPRVCPKFAITDESNLVPARFERVRYSGPKVPDSRGHRLAVPDLEVLIKGWSQPALHALDGVRVTGSDNLVFENVGVGGERQVAPVQRHRLVCIEVNELVLVKEHRHCHEATRAELASMQKPQIILVATASPLDVGLRLAALTCVFARHATDEEIVLALNIRLIVRKETM